MSNAYVRVAGKRLDQYGPVSDLEDATIWRPMGFSGDYEASWSWTPGRDFAASWLRRGATVEIVEGGVVVWRGFLGEPTPGDVWQLVAFGDGADTANYMSQDPDASNINTSILDAYNQGMRWLNYVDDFTGGAFTLTPGYIPIMLDAAIDKVALTQGKVWWVSCGVGELRAESTDVDWVLQQHDTYLGTTEENAITALSGFYVTSVDGDGNPNDWDYTTPTASVPPTLDPVMEDLLGGPRQAVLDLTSIGPLDPFDAYVMTANAFSAMGARPGWTNGFEMTAVNSRSAHNVTSGPMLARAGDRVRIPNVIDMGTSTTFGTSVTVTAGKVMRRHGRTDADDRVAVQPVGLIDRSYVGTVEAARKKYPRILGLAL